MAETNEKKSVKYKFGKHELDLQEYINAIDNDVQKYMDTQGWNEGQRNEFMLAYRQYFSGLEDQLANDTGRFSTDGFGTILDSHRQLSNQDDDGIDPVGSEWYYDDKGNRITTDDYNLLKKRKQGKYKNFQANRHVATYFNTIGRDLVDKGLIYKEPVKEEDNFFDYNKHGFVKYFGDIYNPTGGEWDGSAILNLDPYDEATGIRVVNLRQKRLLDDFNNYINQLSDDINFSKTNFKTKDGYVKHLTGLINKINDGLTEQDYLDLGTVGITKNFLHPFIHTGKYPNQTPEQLEAERKRILDEDAAKLAKEEEEKYQASKREYYLNLYDLYNTKALLKDGIMIDFPNKENPVNWLDAFGKIDPDKLNVWLEEQGRNDGISGQLYLQNLILNYYSGTNEDVNGVPISFYPQEGESEETTRNRYLTLRMLIKRGIIHPLPADNKAVQTLGLKDYYYIPTNGDMESGIALIYNPHTSDLRNTFIGNTPAWEELMRKFDYEKGRIKLESLYLKEGGVMKFDNGGYVPLNRFIYGDEAAKIIAAGYEQDKLNALKARAESNNRSIEEQKAGERLIRDYDDNLNFTPDDIWRLTNSGVDIASAIAALFPGYGTVASAGLGLTSTVSNLFADISDETVNGWDVAGNFASNLGFDLIGMFPAGSGSAGKIAKVVKTLKNVAPKALGFWATYHTLANSKRYYQAWEKLITPGEKITKDDLVALSESGKVMLGIIGGGTRYAKNRGLAGSNNRKKVVAAKSAEPVVAKDKVAVLLLDASGTPRTVLFEGADAAAVRSAQKSGDIAKLKAATVDKFEDLKNFSIQEHGVWRTPREWKELYDPLVMAGYKNRATVPNDVTFDIVTGKKVERTYSSSPAISDEIYVRRPYRSDIPQDELVTPGRKWSEIDDEYVRSQMDPLKIASDEYEAMLKQKAQENQATDALIGEKRSQLQTTMEEGSNKSATDLHEQIKNIRRAHQDGTFAQRKAKSEQTEVEITKLENQLKDRYKRFKQLEDIELEQLQKGKRNQVAATLSAKEKLLAEIKELETSLQAQKDLLGEDTKWLSDFDNADARLLAMVDEKSKLEALEREIKALEDQKKVWDKYTSDGKSKARVEFEEKYKPDAQGNVTFKDDATGREIVRSLNEILSKYKIIHKTGGNLNLQNVRKFQKGQNITRSINTDLKYLTRPTNLQSDAYDINNWDDWYNQDAIYADFLKKSKDLNANDWVTSMNNMNSFSDIAWDKKLNQRGYRAWNTAFDNTGMNEFFGEDESKYDYLGPSTYGRKQFLDYLLNKGTFEVGGQSVKFNDGKWEVVTSPLTTDVESDPYETQVIPTDVTDTTNNNKKRKYNYFNRFGLSSGLDFARAWYASNTNRKITDFAKQSEKPFLQQPFLFSTFVRSNLGEEIAGAQAQAQLNRYFNTPTTSSLEGYMAGKLDAAVKGLDFYNAGLRESNKTYRDTELLALQQEKENARSRHDAANQNALAMHESLANQDKYELANMNKDHEIWDNLIKKYQYTWEQINQENKALQDAFAQKDISNYVTSDLARLAKENGYNLDPEAIKLYQDVKNGVIAASSFADDDVKYLKFMQAVNVAGKLENNEYGLYKGVRRIYAAKEGTKVKLANIKTKQKNADRLAKQLKDDMDRNDKVLDRLSKSIYRTKNRKK